MQDWLRLDVLSWWHAGTGRGDGAEADAVVARTPAGLPWLPGRSVKGLVREALSLAELAGVVTPGRTVQLLGSEPPRAEEKEQDDEQDAATQRAFDAARFTTVPGRLAFSSARPGEPHTLDAWERWARENQADLDLLTRSFGSTRISADGTARSNTLRRTEVALPMTLWSRIDLLEPDDGLWRAELGSALRLLRGLGAHRNRGLGRVRAALEVRS